MRIFQKLTERKLFVAKERLKRIGIKNLELLRLDPKKEGFENFCFGLRSGPVYTVTTVSHELAHAIQFKTELASRILNGRFEFKSPHQIVIQDVSYDNPLTFNGMLREIETFSIEQLINEKMGYNKHTLDSKIKYYFQICRFLPDESVFNSFCKQNSLEPFEHFKALFKQFYSFWKNKDLGLEIEHALNTIEQCRLQAQVRTNQL